MAEEAERQRDHNDASPPGVLRHRLIHFVTKSPKPANFPVSIDETRPAAASKNAALSVNSGLVSSMGKFDKAFRTVPAIWALKEPEQQSDLCMRRSLPRRFDIAAEFEARAAGLDDDALDVRGR